MPKHGQGLVEVLARFLRSGEMFRHGQDSLTHVQELARWWGACGESMPAC